MTQDTIDKHQFKITVGIAIAVVLFIIAQTATITAWKTDMENQHERLNDEFHAHSDWGQGDHERFIALIEELERRQDSTDVGMAEIKTKLSNIEALLVEIKQDIRAPS